MRRNTLGLLMVAIVSIGIFALPSTAALFSGQHSWYNLSDSGSQVPCDKCHGDINAEMIDDNNGVHRGLNASAGTDTCLCHRVTGTGVASGDGTGATAGTTSHAAETIACMLCHENSTRTGETRFPFAGGFNKTAVYQGTDATTEYNYSWGDGTGGEHAAHNAFIQQAIKDDLMEDSNEACIGCHTRVGVNISWTKKTVLEFDATEDETGGWTVTDFHATGSNTTNSSYMNNWTKSY
ncbi:MAG: hypothetical protein CW694_02390 [Candidatus Syntrophoarchaeum sp. WYZ-LMO15]|nr:MAG: hypothetical protein CW694_02390 [Candidatus Syntrophoarchaeum sp. WYZ-LMO15]